MHTRPILTMSCVILLLCLLFYACGRREGARLFKRGSLGGAAYMEEEAKPEERRAEPLRKEMPAGAGAPEEAGASGETDTALESSAPVEQSPGQFREGEAQTLRKRMYSGSCRLRVDDVEKRREEVFRIAETAGGYVESSFGNSVAVRVPAERFRKVFDGILGLGEVVEKSEETLDVTEEFRDLSTRLEVSLKTRDRLYTLLGRTDDVEERLKILQEIRRLTDEIEGMREQMEILKKQISLSRITVELLSRLEQAREEVQGIPFPWIERLNPLAVSLPVLRGRISLSLGNDFAVFKKDRSFRAESAEGTRVRVGSTRNEPRGDSTFWQRAVSYHLGGYYKETQELELGNLREVLFTSKDLDPYFYLVGLAVKGKRLFITEVFFPNREALEQRLEGVKKSLGEMKVR